MSAPSLYHLSSDLAALESLLSEAEEQGDEAAANAIVAAWVEELDGDLRAKLERIARWRVTELAMAAAAKVEVKRLTMRAKTREGRVERLDAAVLEMMLRMGVKVVDADINTFTVSKPGGKDPVVIGDDVDLDVLPADCVRVKKEADKEAIRAHIVAGEAFAGITIKERGPVLRVE